MAIISYSKRETHNLGNYESVSIEISIEDEPEGDETKTECYERLKLWVNEKLDVQFRSRIPAPKAPANQDLVSSNSFLFNELKHKISNLIKLDRSYQDKIKTLLASFGATKLSELSEENVKKLDFAIDNGKF